MSSSACSAGLITHSKSPCRSRTLTEVKSNSVLCSPRRHINDLPPELLVSIMLTNMIVEVKDTRWWLPTVLRRIPFDYRLSHVCQRWRTISLSTPGLWSVLPCAESAPQWAELCLSRCLRGPVDFVIPRKAQWKEPKCQQIIRSMLPHLGRMRTLNWSFTDEYPYEGSQKPENVAFVKHITECMEAQPMPLLEEVDMRFFRDYNAADSESAYYGPSIAPDLFSPQSMPKLWRLTLRSCLVLPLSLTYAHTLRRLILEDVQCWRGVDDMITCLQATPCLEYLEYIELNSVEGTLFFDSTPSRNHVLRCVHLDRLAVLTLEGAFNTNVAIFSYLFVPCSARIRVTGRHYQDGKQNPSRHFAMLCDAFAGHFVTASTAGAHFETVTIEANTIRARIRTASENDNATLSHYFHFDFSTNAFALEDATHALFHFLDSCVALSVFRQADVFELGDQFCDWYPEYATRLASRLDAC